MWYERITQIKILLILVQVFDVIWFIVIWASWTSSEISSPVWKGLRFWHIFVLITSLINFVIKVETCNAVRLAGLRLHGGEAET
jgi:hypothetical protein